MQLVNPSEAKSTGKYLNRFRCLGIENHGFGGAANRDKNANQLSKVKDKLRLWVRCKNRQGNKAQRQTGL